MSFFSNAACALALSSEICLAQRFQRDPLPAVLSALVTGSAREEDAQAGKAEISLEFLLLFLGTSSIAIDAATPGGNDSTGVVVGIV